MPKAAPHYFSNYQNLLVCCHGANIESLSKKPPLAIEKVMKYTNKKKRLDVQMEAKPGVDCGSVCCVLKNDKKKQTKTVCVCFQICAILRQLCLCSNFEAGNVSCFVEHIRALVFNLWPRFVAHPMLPTDP